MIVTQSNVTIAQGYFTKNRAQLGGAIYADNGSVINIHNTTFYSNYANSSYIILTQKLLLLVVHFMPHTIVQ